MTTDHSTDYSCPGGVGVRVTASDFTVYRDGKTFSVSLSGEKPKSGESVIPGKPPVTVYVKDVTSNQYGIDATVTERQYNPT